MGDYFDMVSTNDGAHLAWANTINGGQDVYYSFIPPGTPTASVTNFTNLLNVSVNPNPFSEEITINFSILNQQKVKVIVFDVLGKKVATVLNTEVSGQQKLNWNGTSDNGSPLNNGVYYLKIKTGSNSKTVKILINK
jgi:flagellar hook assembly protein FlgD